MKIIREEQPRISIERFAEHHDLTMKVIERPLMGMGSPWYARFESAEVLTGSCLVGITGNGDSPEEAIRDYARALNGGPRYLVIDAMKPARREILMPYFTEAL